jgi:hypothetical protein
MYPFVDELHIVKLCLWWRKERQIPNKGEQNARKWVVFDKMQ